MPEDFIYVIAVTHALTLAAAILYEATVILMIKKLTNINVFILSSS